MLAAFPDNEKEVILLIAEGNENAFRRLFDYYSHKVYHVALSMTKSSVISEEIVQEVFLKIWLKRKELPAVVNFEGYLFIVARNHIYNTLRQKITEKTFTTYLQEYFLETSSLPEEQMMLKETRMLIHLAVTQLPGQQRAVFDLSRNEGLDHHTIAERLGISKLTVKVHMNKALHAIRQLLQRHHEAIILALIALG